MSYQSILDSPYLFTALFFLPMALISLWVLITPVKEIAGLYNWLALTSLAFWTVGGGLLVGVTAFSWIYTDYGMLRLEKLGAVAVAFGMLCAGATCSVNNERLFRFLCVLRVTSVLILLWLHVTY